MSDTQLLLTGATITQVRELTKEECEREDWYGAAPVALVLDNGAVIYPAADLNGSAPGELMAQADGSLWAVSTEPIRTMNRVLARNILRRAEVMAFALMLLLVGTAVARLIDEVESRASALHVLIVVLVPLLSAGVCWVLWQLTRASRAATGTPAKPAAPEKKVAA